MLSCVRGILDLLIWNVTGNHWPFEIYKTRFSLQFSNIAGNPFSEIDLFTGEEATHIVMAASLRTEELNPAIRFIVKISRSSTAGLTLYLAMPRLRKRRIFSAIFFTSTSSLLIWFPVSVPGLWMVISLEAQAAIYAGRCD